MKVVKKQINIRLNPGTIEKLKEIQEDAAARGFNLSQSFIISDAIDVLYEQLIPFDKTTQKENDES